MECHGYKYLKSHGAADKNMSAMAIIANASYQQSVCIIGTPYTFNTVTVNYRHFDGILESKRSM